ncbi:uncharacterized protein B0I36DRAFT_323036, partial [Microdochium trichocladiopsis]
MGCQDDSTLLTTIISSIDVPPIMVVHIAVTIGLGLKDIIASPQPRQSPDKSAKTDTANAAADTTYETTDHGLRGILFVALGSSYLVTSVCTPIESNQLVHASVPVRLFLAVLSMLRLLFVSGLEKEGKRDM